MPHSKNKKIDKKIRFGLSAIKGVGEDTIQLIIEERRKQGMFKSLSDFLKRIPQKTINKKTLEALVYSGSLDEFGNRTAIAESIPEIIQFGREHHDTVSKGQSSLFGQESNSSISEFSIVNIPDDKKKILQWEKESLGLFVSDHPLSEIHHFFSQKGTPIGELYTLIENDEPPSEDTDIPSSESTQKKAVFTTIHGMVTNFKKIITKRGGKIMLALHVEDTTGSTEVLVFPHIYNSGIKGRSKLQEEAFVRINGRIENRDGRINIIAQDVKAGTIDEVLKSYGNKLSTDTENISPHASPISISIPSDATRQEIQKMREFLKTKEAPDGFPVSIEFKQSIHSLPFSVASEIEKTDFSTFFSKKTHQNNEEKVPKIKNMMNSNTHGILYHFSW